MPFYWFYYETAQLFEISRLLLIISETEEIGVLPCGTNRKTGFLMMLLKKN